MKVVRRFLLAPSLSRLARRERGSARLTEGYFATQSGRNSHVLIEASQCQLVLVASGPDGAAKEERTDVPRAHADALLDVCAGRAVYDRTNFPLGGGREALVDRLSVPGPLDVVSVEFDSQQDADGFTPPPWFGPEVTREDAYDRRSIALGGLPAQRERLPLTDAALDSLLDILEGNTSARSAAAPAPALAPRAGAEAGVLDALRRLSTAGEPSAAAPTMAAPAGVEEPAPAANAQEPEPVEEAVPTWRAAAAASAFEPSARRAEDTRIDDVIAGLSQVLGASSDGPESGDERRPAAVVEVDRWVGRVRRSEG